MTDLSLPSSGGAHGSGIASDVRVPVLLPAAFGIALVVAVLLASAVLRQKADIGRLRSQLGEARAEVAVLNAQLASVPAAQIAAAQGAVPVPMPVSATFEKSFWGDSYTLHVKNTGTASLDVEVTTSITGRAATPATIIKGATLNVAHLSPDSTVAITGDGYETVKLTVP